jgi:hypothetical protein
MREDATIKAFAKQVPFSEVNTLSPLLLDNEEEAEAASPKSEEAVEPAPEPETEPEKQ